MDGTLLPARAPVDNLGAHVNSLVTENPAANKEWLTKLGVGVEYGSIAQTYPEKDEVLVRVAESAINVQYKRLRYSEIKSWLDMWNR
jgi:hypothetical protein